MSSGHSARKIGSISALNEAGIDVIAKQHQIRNVNGHFVVSVARFDAAVWVPHRALIEVDEMKVEGRRAA